MFRMVRNIAFENSIVTHVNDAKILFRNNLSQSIEKKCKIQIVRIERRQIKNAEWISLKAESLFYNV